MLHISPSASSSWKHTWCFNRSCWSLSKAIVKKLLMSFYDLKWPWRHGRGSLVAIFRLWLTILPVSWCLKGFEWFSTKRDAFHFFSHWFTMDRSQYWPDLGSPISKFRCIHFIDFITDINRWKFKGDRSFDIAMLSFQTFFWGKITEIFQLPKCCEMFTCEEKMYDSAAVFETSEKTWRELFKHHPL